MTAAAVTGTGIELRYGSTVALAPSDLTIPGGRYTTLIGPNGSGKSTLLAAMVGLRPSASGTVTVLGTSPTRARPRVALVPQSTKVDRALPVTVHEVVAMARYASLGALRRARRADRHAVTEAMERLDLTELGGRHLGELSGGQQQRVFVAQGLAQERDLLLMDEPLNALDLTSSAVIEEVLDEERRHGRTVVVTTHDLAAAAAADHVVLLAQRVIAEGPPGEVLTAEHLSVAYRTQIIEAEGRLVLDDPAHRPSAPRHVHVDLPSAAHPHPPDGS